MPHQTMITPEGFLYALPKLGVPDPAGEWVRIQVAMGSKADCARLLEGSEVDEAPLRILDALCGTIEIEHDGAVWFLPTSLEHLRSSTTSSVEAFSVKVHRLPASTVPPANRVQMPGENDWLYINKRAGQMGFGAFPTMSEDLLQQLGSKYAKVGLALFRKCADPLPIQCQPAAPLPQAKSADEAAKRREKEEEVSRVGWGLWYGAAEHSIDKEWMQQLTQRATSNMDFRLRISPEEDEDVRGVDYVLCPEGDTRPDHFLGWRPLPAHVAEDRWALTGVNLKRHELGKKLFTKEEWHSRRPTTLMMCTVGSK